MENKSKRIEEIFKQDLSMYLAGRQRVDEQLPDAPDIEEQWAKIGESYCLMPCASSANTLPWLWDGLCL